MIVFLIIVIAFPKIWLLDIYYYIAMSVLLKESYYSIYIILVLYIWLVL